MAAGYIYVLANSSMPDLVKVGKTNRKPSERAQELSGVTGVPTPFIVVYEHHFENCDDAESLIHSLLERNGYRVSANREFFKAPVHEVVAAIMSLPSETPREMDEFDLPPDDEGSEYDDLLGTPPRHSQEPWRDLWDKAEECYLGLGETLQDYQEAFSLYRDAARLGCIWAYKRLGDMYNLGEGVPEDPQKSLGMLKEGAKRGNYVCLLQMANIFRRLHHEDNCEKCITMFIRDRELSRSESLERELSVAVVLSGAIIINLECFKRLSSEHLGQVRAERDALVAYVTRSKVMAETASPERKAQAVKCEEAIKWLESI